MKVTKIDIQMRYRNNKKRKFKIVKKVKKGYSIYGLKIDILA